METHLTQAFATPLGKFLIPGAAELNAGLRRIILAREREERGRQVSNVGGWHSEYDLLEWPHAEIHALRGWIIEAVNRITAAMLQGKPVSAKLQAKAWANVCRRGDYHTVHSHPESTWSGVYYVDPGTPVSGRPTSGLFEFLDPRTSIEMVPTVGDLWGHKLAVAPEAGKMIVFPSWLYHFVHPYLGDGERISVSFNVHGSPTCTQ